ncbi:C2 domain [Phytophthora cinnamomi]|uniref:C2 domain n=1 Tax=Phytophthora cinnamomi TaxID=4785 RepID=UPI003559399B|nr:C2 domain [Phytophthora cinnamomi]
MSSYVQDPFTLSLRVHSGQHLSTHASAAFCSMVIWNHSSPGGPAQLKSPPKYTSFRSVGANQSVEWNEDVQVEVANPASDVLTVRVKDSSDSLVGSCNIYLAHLRAGEPLNQWFQLHPAGHIHIKLVLSPNQRSVPAAPLNPNSPYSAEFQALLDMKMKQRAAAVNECPLPSHIATLLEVQNKAQENAMLMIQQQLRQQQHAVHSNLAQSQPHYPAGFPSGYQPQQSSGSNFHEMVGTAANISTIAANLQQLNGNSTGVDTSGLGTVASIGLSALGLGPLGSFFGS